MIQPQRIQSLNQKSVQLKRDYVLYWMQASQRTFYNHALEYAIDQANELAKPLIVYFGLTDHFPEANLRHYVFMLEGLKEIKLELAKRGIQLMILHTSPEKGVVTMAQKACMVIVDRGYLRIARQWRQSAAKLLDCPLIQIESDVIVPVEITSNKEEYSAATLRRKINQHLQDFITPLSQRNCQNTSLKMRLPFKTLEIESLQHTLNQLDLDTSVTKSPLLTGGTSQAYEHLETFVQHKLAFYAEHHNEPGSDYCSHLSPYLHFGQISPLAIVQRINLLNTPQKETFLEELIIRRELAFNFVYYNQKYDSFQCLPEWARKTLTKHDHDERKYCYTLGQLDQAQTHDIYWNAAQQEMKLTGMMHGYMRMYWGKKILEWSDSPEQAFTHALYLNNRYCLDGRDANSFAGIAWCFGKHDRPWQERSIFGMIRYMNDKGLQRKFDMAKYLAKIEQIKQVAAD